MPFERETPSAVASRFACASPDIAAFFGATCRAKCLERFFIFLFDRPQGPATRHPAGGDLETRVFLCFGGDKPT